MEYIVHQNSYHPMDGSQLQDMLEWKCGARPYAEWMEAFCQRKFNSDFSREMTRSVEEYLKDFRKE